MQLSTLSHGVQRNVLSPHSWLLVCLTCSCKLQLSICVLSERQQWQAAKR